MTYFLLNAELGRHGEFRLREEERIPSMTINDLMTAALPLMTFFHEYFFERKVWETQRNALSR